MTSILVVCLGNICRSPLAHGILEALLPNDEFYVDSAGTGDYHIGHSPDQRSIDVAKQHNIDISHQKARQFQPEDFNTFDHIFVMDQSNYDNVIALAKNDSQAKKVKLLLSDLPDAKSTIVPDPYFGDEDGFKIAFDTIYEACEHIKARLI